MKIALFISNNLGLCIYNYLKKNNIKIDLIVWNGPSLLINMDIPFMSYNKEKVKQALVKYKIDLGITAFFKILPKSVFTIPKYGFINMHYSLLPSYGGPSPVEWQLYYREKWTGVSIHFITENVDMGSIIVQEKIQIPIFNRKRIYSKLNNLGKECLLKAIQLIKSYELNVPIIDSQYKRSYYSFYNKSSIWLL